MSSQRSIYLNATDIETARAAKEHMQRLEVDMWRCRWQAEETKRRLQSQYPRTRITDPRATITNHDLYPKIPNGSRCEICQLRLDDPATNVEGDLLFVRILPCCLTPVHTQCWNDSELLKGTRACLTCDPERSEIMGLFEDEEWFEQRRFEQDLCIDCQFYPKSRSDGEGWDCGGWISDEQYAKTMEKINDRARLINGESQIMTWDAATTPGNW